MNLHLVTSGTSTEWITQAYEIHVEAQFSPWKFTTFEDCLTLPYYCVFAVEDEIVVGYATAAQDRKPAPIARTH